MSEISISILNWVDLIQIPLTIAGIVVLFLKRRIWFALFGLFMAVTGAVLHFPLYRATGSELGDWWWWTWRAQGYAVLAILIVVALSPPGSGSWWDRRRLDADDANAGQRFDRSVAGGILSIVIAAFATLALVVPVGAVLFTDNVIDLGETWPLFVLWSAVAIIGWAIGLRLLSRARNRQHRQ